MNLIHSSDIMRNALVYQLARLFACDDVDINGGDLVEALGAMFGPGADDWRVHFGFGLLADLVYEAEAQQAAMRDEEVSR